jgi:hypothetical protein
VVGGEPGISCVGVYPLAHYTTVICYSGVQNVYYLSIICLGLGKNSHVNMVSIW